MAESQSVEALKMINILRGNSWNILEFSILVCACVCVTYVYIHYERTYEVLDIGFVLVCVYLYEATLFRACSSAE